MSKGILLIGLGLEYTRLAYNLTKSIKKHNPDLKVCCLTDSMDTELTKTFDTVIVPMPYEYIEDYRFNPFKLKTFIYDYSPFDETIYLDVDAICLKDINGLFCDFKIQEVARYDYENANTSDCVWFDSLTNIFDLYELKNDYPEYNSSFIAFNKSKKNSEYFGLVKELYFDRRFDFTKIGLNYPDEMAFSIASSKLKHYSVNTNVDICFWWANKKIGLQDILDKYSFIGFAGGYVNSKYLGYYHQMMKKLSPYWELKMKDKIFHKK
jgi:hypothetical protein